MTIKDQIEKKMIEILKPEFLEVINESHKHRGHAGDDGSGESHFKLKIVSSAFAGKSRLERQRLVLDLLKEEMQKIHALSLELSDTVKN